MLVEIALCTWNRAPLLGQTLATLTELVIPPQVDWQVIVVDNHSTDETAQVLSAFQSRLPLVREFEERVGHTFARNRALRVSRGDLMLWTDDDVRVDPEWLAHYYQASVDQPEMAFWGGRIVPCFLEGRPPWVAEKWDLLRGVFAERDLGGLPVEFSSEVLPYGANFAVRGAVQRAFPFNEGLGRIGQRVVGEDELEMMRRLLAAGHRGRWVPGSLVEHMIPASRATARYVYDYFFGQGVALVMKGRPWTRSRWRLRALVAYHAWHYWRTRYLSRSSVWVHHLIALALARGQARAGASPVL